MPAEVSAADWCGLQTGRTIRSFSSTTLLQFLLLQLNPNLARFTRSGAGAHSIVHIFERAELDRWQGAMSPTRAFSLFEQTYWQSNEFVIYPTSHHLERRLF